MSEQPIFGITNIPQDIKLELNNGTLTLKAGSKVCVPNGVGVFNTITIENDITVTTAGGSNSDITAMLIYDTTSNTVRANVEITRCLSGATEPSNADCWFYNTSTNKIGYWNHSTSTYARTPSSFPLAIVKRSADKKITSIDQVFNGFGYIGSSLFVLPGVEGFYPNGKDGFKNVFTTIKLNRVLIYTSTSAKNNVIGAFSSNIGGYWSSFEVVDKLPELQDMVLYRRYYNKFDNKVYATYDGVNLNVVKDIPWGYFSTGSSSPYQISTLNIVNPFITADLYDYEYSSSKPLSQYANSERYMGLFNNLCYLFNNSKTLEDWYRVVFNLKTASGYGLDIWGIILNQGRQISYEENGTIVNIFLGGEQTIDGITYSADYMENMYRMVLFLKALGYITNCTLASLNSLLQFYFEKRVYVINYGTMAIRYVFEFYASKLEKAIFTTNILPRPTGVLANFEYMPLGEYFGFFVDGLAQPTDQPFAPFDQKPFYR